MRSRVTQWLIKVAQFILTYHKSRVEINLSSSVHLRRLADILNVLVKEESRSRCLSDRWSSQDSCRGQEDITTSNLQLGRRTLRLGNRRRKGDGRGNESEGEKDTHGFGSVFARDEPL